MSIFKKKMSFEDLLFTVLVDVENSKLIDKLISESSAKVPNTANLQLSIGENEELKDLFKRFILINILDDCTYMVINGTVSADLLKNVIWGIYSQFLGKIKNFNDQKVEVELAKLNDEFNEMLKHISTVKQLDPNVDHKFTICSAFSQIFVPDIDPKGGNAEKEQFKLMIALELSQNWLQSFSFIKTMENFKIYFASSEK